MLKRPLRLLRAFAYGHWPRQYIGFVRRHVIPRLSFEGRRRFADGWHGKVLTHENARVIVDLRVPILRRDLEQIVPYSSARTLVLNAPPEIVVFECPCRHTRAVPCQPTQVCMMIGRSISAFMLKHHPGSARRLSQAEALELLRAEHERGHVHSAWFKDDLGGRFYALCNCCRCCCFGIEGMLKHGAPLVASSGYVATLDASRCSDCGVCRDACPFGAILTNGRTKVGWEKCMGCGVCTAQCPEGAITLACDERKGTPLDVRLYAGPSAASQALR